MRLLQNVKPTHTFLNVVGLRSRLHFLRFLLREQKFLYDKEYIYKIYTLIEPEASAVQDVRPAAPHLRGHAMVRLV